MLIHALKATRSMSLTQLTCTEMMTDTSESTFQLINPGRTSSPSWLAGWLPSDSRSFKRGGTRPDVRAALFVSDPCRWLCSYICPDNSWPLRCCNLMDAFQKCCTRSQSWYQLYTQRDFFRARHSTALLEERGLCILI